MKTDNLGIPRFSNRDLIDMRFSNRDLIDMIYSGNIDKCHVVLCDSNDDVDRFNAAMEEQGLPTLQKYIPIDVDTKTFDGVCQSEWFMPDEYKTLNVRDYLSAKSPPMHLRRMAEELAAYEERGMIDLLRYMIYLVDFMRENGIVWGVGRGSSVASYVLYLIGVHRIDSVQYNLDWREFLR